MENQEFSLPARPPVLGGAPIPPESELQSGNPFGERPSERPERRGGLRGRIGSAAAAIVALIAKFFAAIKGVVLLLPKFKLLTTSGTALVSVAAYSLWFGWTFAIGFVVLLFVHEMGHVLQLRREGIKASAPMFIPFLGAVVMMRQMPDDALAEARVGLAGPVLGTAGAAVCLVIGEATGSDFFLALAYIGFFLNLFNLLPIVPLDGGRAMAAMAPWTWFVGFGVLVALELLFPSSDPPDHPAVRGLRALPPLAAAQIGLGRTGRLLPGLTPQPGPRGRRVSRPDRVPGVRHGRRPHPPHRPAQLRLVVARPGGEPQRRASRTARSMSRLLSRSRIVLRLS